MKFYIKSILFILLFSIIHFSHAQETTAAIKAKRNAVKLGTPPIPAKIFFTYEHAFSKHFSLGAMASYGGARFIGYTCNLFTRYYFTAFHENGWFIEARGSYGHYNSYVYSDIVYPNYPYDTRDYTGKHRANIGYWNAGVSGGYKLFCNERMFFEFLAGLHYGTPTFGVNDTYFARYGLAYELGSDKVEEVFTKSGPGYPLHFIINLGFAF